MLLIYSAERQHLLPLLSLFISYKVNLPDNILSFPYQDGGEKAQVLDMPLWWFKKLGLSWQTLCSGSRRSASTTLCLHYKSRSPNGQGWHHDIFKNSKRPGLSGNQFCFTNLGLLFQVFSCYFFSLHVIATINKMLFEFYNRDPFSLKKKCSYFNLHYSLRRNYCLFFMF